MLHILLLLDAPDSKWETDQSVSEIPMKNPSGQSNGACNMADTYNLADFMVQHSVCYYIQYLL